MAVPDTFTNTDGTEASLHSGEPGLSYIQPSYGSTGKAIINSNQLTKDSNSSQAIYYRSDTPPNDQRVAAHIKMLSSISVNAAIVARLNTGVDSYIWARHNRDDNLWTIRETVSSTVTVLTSTSDTMIAGDIRYAELWCIGNQATLFVRRPTDLLTLGPVTVTLTSGRIGWRFGGAASSSTGYAIDDLEGGALMTLGSIARPQFLAQ